MNWEAWAALAILAVGLYALVQSLAGADVVMMGAVAVVVTLSLVSARFPTPTEVAATFGNEGLLTIALLSYTAVLGGVCTLIGTSTNIVSKD